MNRRVEAIAERNARELATAAERVAMRMPQAPHEIGAVARAFDLASEPELIGEADCALEVAQRDLRAFDARRADLFGT